MDSSTIKTFNSAKKFAEEILHPLMISHKEAKMRSNLGGISDEEAIKLNPQLRMIKRYNAMKERIAIQQSLINEIEATVRLNGRVTEIALIEGLTDQLLILEDAFENRSDELIEEVGEKTQLTTLFKEMGRYLDRTYVQVQRIMTKNKLLFFGTDNEFLDNEELMERIKSENRKT